MNAQDTAGPVVSCAFPGASPVHVWGADQQGELEYANVSHPATLRGTDRD